MLVSFKKRLIFLKTKKTAGTSSEVMLQEALWGGPVSHHQGWKIYRDGFVTPRGRRRSRSWRQAALVMAWPAYRHTLGKRLFDLGNHSGHDEGLLILGEQVWLQSTKIANVRNPFALMVSWHFFEAARRQESPELVNNKRAFDSFVAGHFDKTDWQEHITDSADSSWRFIRFEKLERDLGIVAREFGLAPHPLRQLKRGFYPENRRHYRDYYSRYTRRLVEDRYSKWLSEFDYDF